MTLAFLQDVSFRYSICPLFLDHLTNNSTISSFVHWPFYTGRTIYKADIAAGSAPPKQDKRPAGQSHILLKPARCLPGSAGTPCPTPCSRKGRRRRPPEGG